MLDAGWTFGRPGGFDIVIGNPPYVQLQGGGGRLADRYAAQGYEAFDRRADAYCLFYERGLGLLRPGGALCYITSNKWLRAAYGAPLRGLLARESDPLALLDLSGARVFEGATVDTAILLLRRGANGGRTACMTAGAGGAPGTLFPPPPGALACDFGGRGPWVPLSPAEAAIRRKVEAAGTPLGEWGVSINYGIKTGCNEAFVVTTERRGEILAACRDGAERERTERLIRPVLRGDTIERNKICWDGQWLINFHDGYTDAEGAQVPAAHPEDYPAIVGHIDSVAKQIEDGTRKTKGGHKGANKGFYRRTDRGATPYNLRPCKYVDDFNRPKIVWKQTSKKQTFALDKEGFMLDVSGEFLVVEGDSTDELVWLLCFLNSTVAAHWFGQNAVKFGQHGVRWIPAVVREMPIPKSIDSELVRFAKDNLRELGQNSVKGEIDRRVCAAYGLSSEEMEFLYDAVG